MLKLVKYQFIKNKYASLCAVVAVLLLYIMFYFNGINGVGLDYINMEDFISTLTAAPIVVMMFFYIYYFSKLFEEMDNKKGYMLYSTPNSGYKVVFSTALYIILTFIFISFIALILHGIYALNFPEYFNTDIMRMVGDSGLQIEMIETVLVSFVYIVTQHSIMVFICLLVYMSVLLYKCISKGFIISSIMGITAFLMPFLIIELIEFFVNYLLGDLILSRIVYELMSFGTVVIFGGIIATVAGYLLENKVNL